MKANCDIFEAIADAGLRCWVVADASRITGGHFSRLLITELPDSLAAGNQLEDCDEKNEPIHPFDEDSSFNPTDCFRRRLKYLVVFNRLSYGKVALSIGISRQHMSAIANGNVKPNLSILCRIADYFNVSTDYLLGREAK